MKKSKPLTEQISPNLGSSFRVRKFDATKKNGAPFWHFHPEIQLVYVKGGNGKRHVGNHLSYFTNGDLLLIGPNLPHYGLTDQLTGNQSEVIVQFKIDFLGPDFFNTPELISIKQLFDRARLGILFKKETKNEVGPLLEELIHLGNFNRLIALLKILQKLAISTKYELLNAQDYALEVNLQEHERMREIYRHVRTNFKENISLEEISKLSNMTIPAFCRYFKKHSGKTFTQFVNEIRIIHACKLLAESSMPIAEIAFESGFNNFSHFNRFFNRLVQKSPSAYRNDFKQILM